MTSYTDHYDIVKNHDRMLYEKVVGVGSRVEMSTNHLVDYKTQKTFPATKLASHVEQNVMEIVADVINNFYEENTSKEVDEFSSEKDEKPNS